MKKVICYSRGEALGNPGLAGVGVYITDEGDKPLQEFSQTIGNANTTFAEYYAVMVGLQTLQNLYGADTQRMNFELRLDNMQVKKQLNSELQINEPGLVPMFIEIHNHRVLSFPNFEITLITSEENREASRLVKEVLDGKR